MDDLYSGFTPVGSWTNFTNGSIYDMYSNSVKFTGSGSGSKTGTFTPSLPEAGEYEVFAWLDQRSNDGASNQPFTINHDGGPTVVTRNLKTVPGSGGWVSLGSYNFSAGSSGWVMTSDDANGLVVADAIRWYKPGTLTDTPTPSDTPIAPEIVILDNSALSGGDIVGGWVTYTNAQAGGYQFYGGTGLLQPAGSGSETVTFQPIIPKTASYEVFIWVDQNGLGATNMRVEINHAGGQTIQTVNFTTGPGSGGWVSLGIYTFNAGTGGSVVVTDQASGSVYVIADAIRWVEQP